MLTLAVLQQIFKVKSTRERGCCGPSKSVKPPSQQVESQHKKRPQCANRCCLLRYICWTQLFASAGEPLRSLLPFFRVLSYPTVLALHCTVLNSVSVHNGSISRCRGEACCVPSVQSGHLNAFVRNSINFSADCPSCPSCASVEPVSMLQHRGSRKYGQCWYYADRGSGLE